MDGATPTPHRLREHDITARAYQANGAKSRDGVVLQALRARSVEELTVDGDDAEVAPRDRGIGLGFGIDPLEAARSKPWAREEGAGAY